MHVLYKRLKNSGRAKTDTIHVSCIFSHGRWKPEHGAWSRAAVPTAAPYRLPLTRRSLHWWSACIHVSICVRKMADRIRGGAII